VASIRVTRVVVEIDAHLDGSYPTTGDAYNFGARGRAVTGVSAFHLGESTEIDRVQSVAVSSWVAGGDAKISRVGVHDVEGRNKQRTDIDIR
jgi:hypothetical protein